MALLSLAVSKYIVHQVVTIQLTEPNYCNNDCHRNHDTTPIQQNNVYKSVYSLILIGAYRNHSTTKFQRVSVWPAPHRILRAILKNPIAAINWRGLTSLNCALSASCHRYAAVSIAKHRAPPATMPAIAYHGPARSAAEQKLWNGWGFTNPWVPMRNSTAVEMRRHYYAAVAFMDSIVGQLLAALEATGAANNTVVAFWAGALPWCWAGLRSGWAGRCWLLFISNPILEPPSYIHSPYPTSSVATLRPRMGLGGGQYVA